MMKLKAKSSQPRPVKPAPKRKPSRSKPSPSANGTLPAASDVLTLADAAAFLRVSEEDVRKLAEAGTIPGRKVSGAWRFLESKLREWLSQPEPDTEKAYHQRIMAAAGAMADDDSVLEMLEKIYEERRKHPVSEIQD